MATGESKMTPPRDEPATRFRSQAILVIGAGLATGLQLGFMQAFMTGSRRALLVYPIASLFFAGLTLMLWQLVFPRLPARPRGRRLFLQGTIALVSMALASFVVVNTEMLISGRGWIFTRYVGGDIPIVISADVIAIAPFIYFLLPMVLPQAVRMTIPPLTNRTIAIIKGTALGSVVGMYEILASAQSVVSDHYNPSPLLLGSAAYLVLFIPVVAFGRWVETRFAWKR